MGARGDIAGSSQSRPNDIGFGSWPVSGTQSPGGTLSGQVTVPPQPAPAPLIFPVLTWPTEPTLSVDLRGGCQGPREGLRPPHTCRCSAAEAGARRGPGLSALMDESQEGCSVLLLTPHLPRPMQLLGAGWLTNAHKPYADPSSNAHLRYRKLSHPNLPSAQENSEAGNHHFIDANMEAIQLTR